MKAQWCANQDETRALQTSFFDDTREFVQNRLELPHVDFVGPQNMFDRMMMGSTYPGGDVAHQSLSKKLGRLPSSMPISNQAVSGALLGEASQPNVAEKDVMAYLQSGLAPPSASEDELAFVAQAGEAARRAKHAAVYARVTADQANKFMQAAATRAAELLRDPPISVLPTADIFPFYSASMSMWCVIAASNNASPAELPLVVEHISFEGPRVKSLPDGLPVNVPRELRAPRRNTRRDRDFFV
eukprot:TRINITY_DN36850_c0_g1_i1.p1 TRINITY_DN36850_c0_g1~~TRINITY_DN36850_c0_g1_i1.p1  ORF type:complete len:243 (+),score=28.82 TRINITY_DN36850_c0_g1_i1:137-865(+)